jgi:enoyl-CoA hydratase
LANRLTEPGGALDAARGLARELAAFPQACLRNDRRSAYEQAGRTLDDAMANEYDLGLATLASEEFASGVARFVAGEGRHGQPSGA